MVVCELCGRADCDKLHMMDTGRMNVLDSVRFRHICSSCLKECKRVAEVTLGKKV